MPWKCPQCGVQNPDGASACQSGDFTRFPPGLVLASRASGREVTIRLASTLGVAQLRALEDPGIRFASAAQFSLEKREREGHWLALHVAAATNLTFHNGEPIPAEGKPLKNGDVLSIKDKHLHLTIRLL